jgi:hypothetical protein
MNVADTFARLVERFRDDMDALVMTRRAMTRASHARGIIGVLRIVALLRGMRRGNCSNSGSVGVGRCDQPFFGPNSSTNCGSMIGA